MRLMLSKRFTNFLLLILFMTQFIIVGFFNINVVVVGTVVSVIIMLFFLRYASLHTSSLEVYGVFLHLLLVVTLAVLSSLVLFYLILGRLKLSSALYAMSMSLSVLLVYLTIVKLIRRP